MSEQLVTGTDFVYVFTQDIEKSEAFYGGTLGLPVGQRYGQMPGVEFETGNLTIAVIQAEAFGQKFSVSDQAIALRTDDVAAAREKLESEGVKFVADTIDSGVCHMAFFEDPDGNKLLFHHRYAPRD
jgi:catechol 2,3-dioxygenase-like lactoylglutathione lyase family enzyme